MYEFKKVGIWSLTRFYAMMGLIIGFIAGLIFALAGSLINSFVDSTQGVASSMMGSLSWISIIVFPILYGLGGLIGGVISALLYNGISRLVGGVMFDVIEVEEGKPKQ